MSLWHTQVCYSKMSWWWNMLALQWRLLTAVSINIFDAQIISKGCLKHLFLKIISLMRELTALHLPMCIGSALCSPRTIPLLSMCPYTCHCSIPDAVEAFPPHCIAANPLLCHCSADILLPVAALLHKQYSLNKILSS